MAKAVENSVVKAVRALRREVAELRDDVRRWAKRQKPAPERESDDEDEEEDDFE